MGVLTFNNPGIIRKGTFCEYFICQHRTSSGLPFFTPSKDRIFSLYPSKNPWTFFFGVWTHDLEYRRFLRYVLPITVQYSHHDLLSCYIQRNSSALMTIKFAKNMNSIWTNFFLCVLKVSMNGSFQLYLLSSETTFHFCHSLIHSSELYFQHRSVDWLCLLVFMEGAKWTE